MKKWLNYKISQKPKLIWTAFFAVFCLTINYITIHKTASWNQSHVIALLLGNLALLVAIFVLILLYQLTKKVHQLSGLLAQKYYRWSLILLALALFFVPFIFMIHMPDSTHAWDYFVIFNGTSELAGKSFSHLPMTVDRLGYFLRYSNNQFFAVLFNQIFAPFASQMMLKNIMVTGLSAVLTSLGLLASSLALFKLSNHKLAIVFNLAAFIFMPFYLYGAQLYSDSMSLPFVGGAFLLIVMALQASSRKKQVLYWILAILLIVIGYQFKPTVAILMIAVYFFLILNKKWKILLLTLVLFGTLFVGMNKVNQAVIATEPAFSDQARNRYDLPVMHWITMSWSPTNETGGFKTAIREYSESFPDKASKTKADKALFIENMKEMGWSGILRQIGRKLKYTWLVPDLGASYYTNQHENKIINQYFDYLPLDDEGNVTGWSLYQAAQSLFWFPFVIMLWIGIIQSLRKKNWTSLAFIPALAVFGLSVFLILWEANSRYLYHFMPLMLIVGLPVFYSWVNCKRKDKI